VAKPDPVRDVVPIAFVVAVDSANPPDSADLDAFARVNLSPQSRPREWHYVDSLPRTSVGKIRRFALTAGDNAKSAS
jgi:crotonobetaine/carnitine-CoA ligase